MSKAVSNVPLSKDALLKSYRKRLRDDIGSMTANFMEIFSRLANGFSVQRYFLVDIHDTNNQYLFY